MLQPLQGIFIASGLLSYQEPINDVSDSLKSFIASVPIEKRENIGRINNNLLNVFPNPATSYTIIDYLLPKSDKATLNIISNNGNVIWQKELAKTMDQVVVDLHGYAKGSYTVSIVSNKKIIATCSLIIVN